MLRRLIFAIALLPTAAIADEPPKQEPTVTLTQSELSTVIASESQKAVANYIAELQKSTPIYNKITNAFRPVTPAPEKPH